MCVDVNETDLIKKPNVAYTPDQLHQAILCHVKYDDDSDTRLAL